MKTSMFWLASLIVATLFWYGYTYSLTVEAFAIQGWIGAAIPAGLGAWLFGAGFCAARLS